MASAPKSFGSQLQLNKIPVLGLVAESSANASPPASAVNGQLWYDTTNNRMNVRENGAWVLASLTGAELTANKGVASGYASLDGTTKVPIAQLPTGTTGTTVALGNDSRFTDSRTPTGAAGGSLTGTYPNPTIAALAVTDAMVATANKDGVAGTASMRTLGSGAQQAMAGNTRLDQITAPASSVSMNSQKITSLLDPTSAQDAATKAYVDSMSAGLDPKASVRAASTANVAGTYNATGGTSGRGQFTAMPNTIDGVTLAANNRVLLKNQTSPAQNGIYVVSTLGTGANGVWDRATDFDQDAEVTAGAFTFVEEGTQNDNTGWVLTTNNPITVGGGAAPSSLTFSQFSSSASLTAGNGLTQTGNTFDVVGTAGRISVAADSIDIDSGYVGQTSITTLGTITTGTWTGTAIAVANGGTGATTAAGARTNLGTVGKYAATLGALTAGSETTITHSLNSSDVHAMFRLAGTGYDEVLSWRVIDANTIGVTADIAYSASALRVTVIG